MNPKNFRGHTVAGHSVVVSLGILLLALSIGCGGGGASSGTGSSSSSQEAGATATLSGITELTISGHTASVTLTDVDPDASYLVSLYSYNTTSNSFDFSVNADSSPKQAVKSSEDIDNTEDFHDLLRQREADLADLTPAEHPSSLAVVKALTVGSSTTFKVINSFSDTDSYDTVTAELRMITDNVYVYVDERNASALDDDDLEELVAPFENIIDEEKELFGDESDINADGHITVLFTQAVNELGAMSGGIVSGFFYGGDLYDSSDNPVSNEREMMYAMVPDPSGSYGTPVSKRFSMSNILPSVLPHEFQHMISYNQHVLINGGSAEQSFLNEGLSHLAEDIYSLNDSNYMVETGIENPSRVALYLQATNSTCFSCGASIVQRGGSYLFVRYLYEQAEKGNLAGASTGAELIELLESTTRTGTSNLVFAALNSTDSSQFQTLMAFFSAALYLSDTGLTTDNRYAFDGISLRADQNDNRGTVLDGPAIDTVSSLSSYSGSVTSAGMTYFLVSGSDLIDAGSTLSFNLPSDMSAGGFVLVLN